MPTGVLRTENPTGNRPNGRRSGRSLRTSKRQGKSIQSVVWGRIGPLRRWSARCGTINPDISPMRREMAVLLGRAATRLCAELALAVVLFHQVPHFVVNLNFLFGVQLLEPALITTGGGESGLSRSTTCLVGPLGGCYQPRGHAWGQRRPSSHPATG